MNSRIDEFIQYIAQLNPAFIDLFRGATREELSRLEQLSGVAIQDEYKDFLMQMGHCSGSLALDMDGTANVTDIISLYEDHSDDGVNCFPDNCIALVTRRISDDIYVEFLDDRESRVVYVEDDEIVGIHAESFIKFLYRSAFDALRIPTLPHSAFFTSSFAQVGHKNVLHTGWRIAQELGFSPEWFSDSVEVCGTSEASLISITQFEGEGLSVSMSSNRTRDIVRVGWKFKKELGLELEEWSL